VRLELSTCSKLLILRGLFFPFLAIFDPFGRFWSFLDPDFPGFGVFSTPRYGILDPRSQPCVVAHPEQELKRANWPPEVTGFRGFVQVVDLGLNALFSLLKWILEPL
jgi:hypothetical protein